MCININILSMEINILIIAQNNSTEKFEFNNKINLVTSTLLSNDLLKENYNLEDSPFVIESNNNLALKDTFQLKIKIAQTGIMMVYFDKETISDEQKQNLFNEIKTLKDGVTPTFETQKEKIKKVVEIIAKYNPIFTTYFNNGDFVFSSHTLEELLVESEFSFPILIAVPSVEFEEKLEKEKKNKPAKAKKEPKEKSAESYSFVEALKCTDFIFFGIFSAFIAFGSIISGFEIKNGEGIAVFLIVLSVAFFGVLTYAAYKSYKEKDLFQYKLKNLIIPASYVLVGIALGILIGFLVTTFVVKPKEGIEIKITQLLLIGGAIALASSILALALPKPISLLINKISKKGE